MESLPSSSPLHLQFPSSQELLARFTYYDYAVFVCMLAVSGSLGLWSAWQDSRSDTHSGISLLLNGERRLPPVPVGASLMASFISAAYLLGNAAEVYRSGTLYLMTFVSYVLALAVTAHLFMPVFYRLGVMTAYEYLEMRFNRTVRIAAVILYMLEMTVYIAISLYAPALALSQLTGMTLWSAVVAIGLVCTAYTSIGGIKAVVLTDTFQAVVTIVAMVVVVALGVHQMGGMQAVWQTSLSGGHIQFNVIDPNPTIHYTVWGLAIGAFFSNAASYATNHMMVLRYLTVPTLSQAKFVVWFNFPLLCTVLSLSCLAGLLVYVKYASCDPVAAHQISTEDQLLPYFVMDVLGKMTGVPGLFVAGIFAASLRRVLRPADDRPGGHRFADGQRAGRAIFAERALLAASLPSSYAIHELRKTPRERPECKNPENDGNASQVINSSIGGPLLGLFTLGMFVPCANSMLWNTARHLRSLNPLVQHACMVRLDSGCCPCELLHIILFKYKHNEPEADMPSGRRHLLVRPRKVPASSEVQCRKGLRGTREEADARKTPIHAACLRVHKKGRKEQGATHRRLVRPPGDERLFCPASPSVSSTETMHERL
ncbi:sodium-dependent multivitamin transporter-like isoform X4 [Amblyomma americanum]